MTHRWSDFDEFLMSCADTEAARRCKIIADGSREERWKELMERTHQAALNDHGEDGVDEVFGEKEETLFSDEMDVS